MFKKEIDSRLRPIYWSGFLSALTFWYVAQLMLAQNIGISKTTIGVIIAVYALIVVSTEIPFGVLADKWSRKRVLLLALLFFMASTFFGAIATTLWQFAACYFLWGIYYAAASGIYNSLIYDSVVELCGNDIKFEKYNGVRSKYESLGWISGSLVGGVAMAKFNVHTPFYMTLVPLILAFLVSMRIVESKYHKPETEYFSHFKDTLKEVFRHKQIVFLYLTSAFVGIVVTIILELDQLWYVDLRLPLAFFGVANAIMLGSFGLAPVVLERLHFSRLKIVPYATLLSMCSTLLLLFNNLYASIVALFIILTLLSLIDLAVTPVFNGHIRSQYRTGASSVVSSTRYVLQMVIVIAFTSLADKYNLGIASILFLVILAVSFVISLFLRSTDKIKV